MTRELRSAAASLALAAVSAIALQAQQAAPKSFQSHPTADVTYTNANGEQSVEYQNIAYETASPEIPGRPRDTLLLLRTTIHAKEVVGDMGKEATAKVEAWPLGVDPKLKPLYSVTVPGDEVKTLNQEVFTIQRGLEEVNWWTVYRLGTGQRLFDTYVPLLNFSIVRDTVTNRYVGLENPEDDVKDPRLKEPHVVGVVTYAAADHVIREVLITSDDVKQAQLLRSFADVMRVVTVSDEFPRSVKIVFTEDFPSPPRPVTVVIPIAGDTLDAAHAQLPARLHAAVWKR